jgi:hypothetical protein
VSGGAGATVPEFEVESADNLQAFRVVDSARCFNATGPGHLVPANVYTRMLQFHIVNILTKSVIKINDRSGSVLPSAWDVEICFVACKLGLGVGIFPELKSTHLIPMDRVVEDYLVKLAEGMGTSKDLLSYEWEKLFLGLISQGRLECLRVSKNVVALPKANVYCASSGRDFMREQIVSNYAE